MCASAENALDRTIRWQKEVILQVQYPNMGKHLAESFSLRPCGGPAATKSGPWLKVGVPRSSFCFARVSEPQGTSWRHILFFRLLQWHCTSRENQFTVETMQWVSLRIERRSPQRSATFRALNIEFPTVLLHHTPLLLEQLRIGMW